MQVSLLKAACGILQELQVDCSEVNCGFIRSSDLKKDEIGLEMGIFLGGRVVSVFCKYSV